MDKHLPPKFIISVIAISSVFYFAGYAFAQGKAVAANKEDAGGMLEQAQLYRQEGFRLQGLGRLPEAMGFYQKAIVLDPSYGVPYNDLGIIYEAMGEADNAEENYLKSINVDPNYASAYANLALLYEGQRNLEKAAFYWDKRIKVGAPDDPWTHKAMSRLKDIRTALSNRPIADEREEEVLSLIQDVAEDKTEFNKDDQTLAQIHFKKAKQSFAHGDLATAIKEALDAQYLDQDNTEIEAFIEKTERRALMR